MHNYVFDPADITAHLHVIERKSRPGYTYDESVGNKRVVRLRENV